MTDPAVIFKRVSPGHYRHGKGWHKGIIQATVNGHDVAHLEGKGWVCRCDQDECSHIATVAQHIAPQTLAQIAAGRDWTATK